MSHEKVWSLSGYRDWLELFGLFVRPGAVCEQWVNEWDVCASITLLN